MKKRRLSSVLTLCFILVVVAVISRTQHRPDVPAPSATAKVAAPSAKTEAVSTSPDRPSQVAASEPSSQDDGGGSTFDPDLNYETVRLIVNNAPIPAGPVRGAAMVAESLFVD